jgi:hypothetical protein
LASKRQPDRLILSFAENGHLRRRALIARASSRLSPSLCH